MRRRDFLFSLPPLGLGIEEIWPEGDAPDDPTVEDVWEQIRKTSGTGGFARFNTDWGLWSMDDLEIS